MVKQGLAVPVVGEIRGTGIVRDKTGKVKGRIIFAGPATVEQAAALQKLVKIEGVGNVTNPDNKHS